MSDQAATIILTEKDIQQDIATVKSTLAMPIESFGPEFITMEAARQHQLTLNEDLDNKERKQSGETAANYYFGRLQLEELKAHMIQEFPETWESKFKQAENFVKSVSRQLSQIYKSPPSRDPVFIRGASNATDTALQEQDEIIDLVYKRGQVNKSMQEIERFAKWARSVLIRVMYQVKGQRIFIKPYAPQFWDVMVSESGTLQAVTISDYFENHNIGDAKESRRFWIWTSTEIGMFEGSKLAQVEVQPNPLGRIPFVLFNDDLAVENEKPYLHPDTLMVNTNLALNRLLSDGMSLAKYQTYGQPYVIGGDADGLPETTGHNEFLHFKQGAGDSALPQVGILQPKGDFVGLMKFMERIANGYGTTRGLASNSFSAEKSLSSSGVALRINNHSLIEMRQGEEDKYRPLENEIFPIVRAFHNLASGAPNGHKLPEIREDLELNVDFGRTDDAFESPAEMQRQALTEVVQGLLKRSDFVRMRFRSKSQEEALQYLKEVQTEATELGVNVTIEDIDRMIDTQIDGQ